MRSDRAVPSTPGHRGRRTALALGVLGALSIAAAQAEIIERILAVVDGRPVMLSEVALAAQVLGVDRDAALEAVIDEQLMLGEARRLAQAGGEEAAFQSLRAQLPEPALDEDVVTQLRQMARRQATILRYIDFRFRPLVRIDKQQLLRAYEAEYGARAEAPSFESVEAQLRVRLERHDLDRRIEAWVKDLREAADVRYNPQS